MCEAELCLELQISGTFLRDLHPHLRKLRCPDGEQLMRKGLHIEHAVFGNCQRQRNAEDLVHDSADRGSITHAKTAQT
jgi:hypothetical protein